MSDGSRYQERKSGEAGILNERSTVNFDLSVGDEQECEWYEKVDEMPNFVPPIENWKNCWCSLVSLG